MSAGDHSLQQAAQLLLRPDVRHHLSKILYAEDWARSIDESHPVSEARSVTLAKHWEDVAKLKSVLHVVHSKLLPVMQDRTKYAKLVGESYAWF